MGWRDVVMTPGPPATAASRPAAWPTWELGRMRLCHDIASATLPTANPCLLPLNVPFLRRHLLEKTHRPADTAMN